ncbi:MAG: bifunctional UDP-N-acetylglucosamine diphosphorylase/glucosamine-1-phosphate N-acetyltransferase GlmU [Rhizobiaceae bacterium]
MQARTCLSVILAAGEGTRMKSALPKVLHPLAGLPLIAHVANATMAAGSDSIAVVTGKGAGAVEAAVASAAADTAFYLQDTRLGTAHAVLAARAAIERGHDDILVLFGDTPLVRPQTLVTVRRHLADGAAVAVLGFRTDDPTGYGRLIQENGRILAIREDKDCTDAERRITFCNGGLMAISGALALELLDAVGNDNAKSEYYLTDIVGIAAQRGLNVAAVEAPFEELLGINNRAELAAAEAIWQARRRRELMLGGVSMQAPETVYFSHDTVLGPDCVIEPDVWFGPGVAVGAGVRIRAYSHIEGATVADGAEIGPFARLRPGAELATRAKVGNFCEVKKATIGEGAKVNHLTYVGDASVGAGANIGAGTITCNYDGYNKYRTEIGAGAFIGSNSALVAPVSIGDGALVAAGSVITRDVPADALAVGRGDEQIVREGKAAEINKRNAARKAAK